MTMRTNSGSGKQRLAAICHSVVTRHVSFTFLLGSLSLSFLFPFFCLLFSFFFSLSLLLALLCDVLLFVSHRSVPSAIMVHSSRSTRIPPERSRSRDSPMWQPHPSQRHRPFRDSWQEVPTPPRLRDVLVIVNLHQLKSHMARLHDDIMNWTTCEALPLLGRQEEQALFTYSVLITKERLRTFTVYNLLYTISQHIWNTWDRYLRPSSMDIRWQDDTDDTFVLREEDLLVDLLHTYRPHWTEGQEYGLIGRVLFPDEQIRYFTSHSQPYIMRVSCHEALPNPNMLP